MEERGLDFTAYLTWAIATTTTLLWLIERHALATPAAIAWIACAIAFIVMFSQHLRIGLAGVLVQAALALACCSLQSYGFQPVLLVIVAAQLGRFSLRVAIPVIVVQSIAAAFTFEKPESTIAILLGYVGFQLFGLFTARIIHKERLGRLALAAANADLRVATELLEMNSRSAERLRIARDLHDLLGHHLAALSINLEVARHLAEGEAREQVEKSQAVTKLLLSDVRDVVSRLREDEPIDLNAAVASLKEVIQQPSLHLDLAPEVNVKDPAVAQIALRAVQEIVTNAVRHSGARNLWLKVARQGDLLAIDARDDGSGTDVVSLGNGLRGMRERVEEARGSMEVASMRGRGFEVHVKLPLQGGPA